MPFYFSNALQIFVHFIAIVFPGMFFRLLALIRNFHQFVAEASWISDNIIPILWWTFRKVLQIRKIQYW